MLNVLEIFSIFGLVTLKLIISGNTNDKILKKIYYCLVRGGDFNNKCLIMINHIEDILHSWHRRVLVGEGCHCVLRGMEIICERGFTKL